MGDFVFDSTPQWFALYTTPRHEKRIATQLQESHVETFLPVYRTVHVWKNRKHASLELPLFPSYVFVRMSQNQKKAGVLSIPGVQSFVGSRGKPWPLPDFEIEKLRTGLRELNVEPHPYLVVGDRARIRSGPLSGMEGVLVQMRNGPRVVLTIEAIMRSVSVEVETANLERCQDQALAS
jgi:transcription antitermination factor NusG